MSLLDKASLVITPNGYKENVLYSVVPNTTLGDMTVVRATTATRVNSLGLIESVANNVPRIDYTNGSCPSLLVEPQRTNLALYSEQFDNEIWLKINTVISANTVVSPDGTQNADTYPADQGNLLYEQILVNTNTVYTISLYVKLGTATNLCLVVNNQASWNTIGGQSFNSSNGLNTSTWTKISYTFTTPAILAGGGINFHIGGNSEIGLTQSTGTVFIWGAQLEQGSYPTSYIPTVASTVTRNADVISKTGISSLIGQTEGTILFDAKINGCENSFANLINSEKNVITSFAISYIKSTKKIEASIFDNGAQKGNIDGGPYELGERVKVAYAYKSGNFALYINGNLIGTSASTYTFPTTLDDIFIGDVTTFFGYQESISNNITALWKTRLTNAELATLTTL